MAELVLSLFAGVGLFDLAFQESGFSIVRGPDLIHGATIDDWHFPPAGRIDGIIAGPPCQGFSVANTKRNDPTHPSVVNSLRCLQWTVDAIRAVQPEWFVIENVPGVPDVSVEGYTVQRIAISDWECGGDQLRWRAIQWGHRAGVHLRPVRVNDRSYSRKKGRRPVAITTKPASRHSTFAEQCRRQGLPVALELPGWTKDAKFRAVGNGVPLSVGRVIAAAVRDASIGESPATVQRVGPFTEFDCSCGCGRAVTPPAQRAATAACRKRLQIRRERARTDVL